MDDYLSLRSLEGSGRPFGTERSLNSPERARERNSERPEVQSDRAAETRSKERTQDTDRGHEAKRGDFSRELDELEVSKQSDVSSQPTSEPAEEPVLASPSIDLEPTVASTAGELLAADLAAANADPGTLLKPTVELEEPTADVPASVVTPQVELPPPLVIAPLAFSKVKVLEGVPVAGADTAAVSVELATTLEAGSGSPDAETGGLANQATEQTAAASAKAETARTTFDQALTETTTKQASSSAHNVKVAESVLQQFKIQLNPKLDHALIQLHPAELGRISIKIEMERGKMRAVLRADKAETLELLERHVPELRASLEGSGIEAESFEFGLGLEQDGSDTEQPRAASAWKDQTKPILEELEKRSLLTKAIVNEKRVDTYA